MVRCTFTIIQEMSLDSIDACYSIVHWITLKSNRKYQYVKSILLYEIWFSGKEFFINIVIQISGFCFLNVSTVIILMISPIAQYIWNIPQE